jgi:two-component system, chemotaxis family, protein-glutamate methylesterase/glutaminase
LTKQRILILEKYWDLSSSVEKYFAQKEADYQILPVETVRQAIEKMTNDNAVGLAISKHDGSDGIDGLELLREIREAALPVRTLLLADPSLENDRNVALGLGCASYLVKPVPEEKFCDLALSMLQPNQGFAGRVVGMRLEDIVQMFCYRRDSTLLTVFHNGSKGTIYVHHGGIVHSRCGSVTGVDAFYEILEWEYGEFLSQVIFDVPEQTIFLDWQSLLMEGIRQKDEIRHALSPIAYPENDNEMMPSSLARESVPTVEFQPAEAPARRIMIVDDSRFIRKIVQEIIESDSALSVAGYATNGQDALAKIEEIKPDLILLDWDMPVMKGSTALMHIMIKTPCPVIILSSFAGGVGLNPIDLLCLGGVDFLRKPQNNWRLDGRADDLVRRVKEASSIKFGRIRRVKVPPQVGRNQDLRNDSRPARFLTILASSVGGSADLIRLIPSLSAELPSAVLAVHDMQQEALPAFIDYLQRRSRIQVQPLKPGHWLSQGVCYIHPAAVPIELAREQDRIVAGTRGGPQRSALDDLLLSASKVLKANLLAVLLSGGSEQGTDGFKAVRREGGITLVQDPSSSASPRMAEAAIGQDIVDHIVSAESLAASIEKLIRKSEVKFSATPITGELPWTVGTK